MVITAAAYQAVLDAIYDAITGLDATPYRIDGASAWTRGRRMTTGGGSTSELEVLVDLGRVGRIVRASVSHEIAISWPMRYRPSSEAEGGVNDQARFHAAGYAVSEALLELRPAEQARTVPTGWQVLRSPAGDEWVTVELTASLSLPRGA